MTNRQDEFKKMFPQIDTIRVEYVLCSTGKGDHNADYKYIINDWLVLEPIKCKNPCCLNGEYKLWYEIPRVAKSQEAIKEGSILCEGNEGTKRKYKRCLDYIKYKMIILYKVEQPV